jgi:hypothetical protein
MGWGEESRRVGVLEGGRPTIPNHLMPFKCTYLFLEVLIECEGWLSVGLQVLILAEVDA